LDVLERSWSRWFTATGLSHAFWMCLASLVGTEVPERLVQMLLLLVTDRLLIMYGILLQPHFLCYSSCIQSTMGFFYTTGVNIVLLVN